MNRFFRDIFVWLSGAGPEEIEQCPSWEQRKYVAFGATVLVPCLFAVIACGYALSTLTDDWRVIAAVSAVWAFIILAVDRALLASYRAFLPVHKKLGQFFLRFVVAMLMGVTIAHPLTLLIFRDTIHSEIERDRQTEVAAVREDAAGERDGIRVRLEGLEDEVAAQQQKWDETFNAQFLVAEQVNAEGEPEENEHLPDEVKAEIGTGRAPFEEKIAGYQTNFDEDTERARTLQADLDHWQREFEREVNGQRSGIVGLGPRAKSIRDDQLVWRRDESKRLATQLEFLTTEMNRLRTEADAVEAGIVADYEVALAAQMKLDREEADRVLALKRQLQQEQTDQFVGQQNLLRANMAKQMEAKLQELGRVQEELATVTKDENTRVEEILAEPRRDLLVQSLAMHHLWKNGGEGGQFAFTAYIILTLLFMLVDTMPLLVKFFSKPGPYDALLDRDEIQYEKDRETFVSNYASYTQGMQERQLGAITQDKPLEQALIHGVERSRATQEFMESVFEMERAFEERMAVERARAAEAGGEFSAEKVAMLENMAQAFYADLRTRTERFFQEQTEKGTPA